MPSPATFPGNTKGKSSGAGGTASSAQADSAAASSAQADSAQNLTGVNLKYSDDPEYKQDYHTTVAARIASRVPRPMPELTIEKDSIPQVKMSPFNKETRPHVLLPMSNLEHVTPAPGMSYNEDYQWRLSKLLEGHEACVEPLPTWDPDGPHFRISKFLGWATRHSEEVKRNAGNWVSIDFLLDNNRRKLHTPDSLFQAVYFNEKGRYQFSRPMYEVTQPKRATAQSRASGQVYHTAKIYIRALQGHSQSSDPTAALLKLNEDNMPPYAIHGTTVDAAQKIVAQGMIPGGGTGAGSSDHLAK